MRRFVFTAFALTVLAGCQPETTELTAEQRATIAETVTQSVMDATEALNTLDVDGWLTHFAGELWWGTENGFGDRAITEAGTRARFASLSEVDYVWSETDVRVLGPDAAVFWGTYAATAVDTEGASSSWSNTITLVYCPVGGHWKAAHAHASAIETETT